MNLLYVLHNLPDTVPESISQLIPDEIELFAYDMAHRLSTEHTIYILYVDQTSMKRVLHKINTFKNSLVREFEDTETFCIVENFKSILEEYKIDLVHYHHMLYSPMEYALIAKSAGVKQILSIYNHFYICDANLENDNLTHCNIPTDIKDCCTCMENKNKIAKNVIVGRARIMQKFMSYMDLIVFPSKTGKTQYYRRFKEILDKVESDIIEPLRVIPYIQPKISPMFFTEEQLDRNRPLLNILVPEYFTYANGMLQILSLINSLNNKEQTCVNSNNAATTVSVTFYFHENTPIEQEFKDKLLEYSNVVFADNFPYIDLVWLPSMNFPINPYRYKKWALQGYKLLIPQNKMLSELPGELCYTYDSLESLEKMLLSPEVPLMADPVEYANANIDIVPPREIYNSLYKNLTK